MLSSTPADLDNDGMQVLSDCSISEAAQENDAEEEQQQEVSPGKGLGGIFGRTQSVKAQPQQPQVLMLFMPASCKTSGDYLQSLLLYTHINHLTFSPYSVLSVLIQDVSASIGTASWLTQHV